MKNKLIPTCLVLLFLSCSQLVCSADVFPNIDAATNLNNLAHLFTFGSNTVAYYDTNGQPVYGLVNSNGRTIEFQSGTYQFTATYGVPGLQNAFNLTIKGASPGANGNAGNNGSTILSWTPNYPGIDRLFRLESACRNILVKDLTFTSPGNSTYRYQGAHLTILASHVDVQHCTFSHGPTFALHIKGDTVVPEYIHVDSCLFDSTYGDGLHISWGNEIWMTGNYFTYCRDDSFAIYDDSHSHTSSNIHFQWNIINIGGANGVKVVGASGVYLEHNFICSTARESIFLTEEWAPTSNVVVANNTLAYAGSQPAFLAVDVVSGAPAPYVFSCVAGLKAQTINYLSVYNNFIDHATYKTGPHDWQNIQDRYDMVINWCTDTAGVLYYLTNSLIYFQTPYAGATMGIQAAGDGYSYGANRRYTMDQAGNILLDGNGNYRTEPVHVTP